MSRHDSMTFSIDMVASGSSEHIYLIDFCGNSGHRYQHSPAPTGPWTQTWPLAAARDRTSPVCSHICLFLTAIQSPVLSFSTVYEALGFTFSSISPLRTPTFPSFHHTSVYFSGTCPRSVGILILAATGWGRYYCNCFLKPQFNTFQ